MMIGLIFVLVMNGLQVFLVSDYFSGFFDYRFNQKLFYLMSFFILLLSKVQFGGWNQMIGAFSLILALTMIVFLGFEGKRVEKFYQLSLFLMVLLMLEYFFGLWLQDPSLIGVWGAVAICLIYACIWAVLQIMKRYCFVDKAMMPAKTYVLMSITPILSQIIGLWSMSQVMVVKRMIFLLLLLINLLNLLIEKQLITQLSSENEKQLLKWQKKQLELQIKSDDELKMFKHDVRKAIQTVTYLLADNQVSLAQQQLEELLNERAIRTLTVTGNPSMDALVNPKIAEIKKHHAELEIESQIPHDLEFPFLLDLSFILGNLLDNAVEAVLRIGKEENRWIRMNIKCADGALYFLLQNAVNPETIRESSGVFRSTKQGSHGFGIQSVQKRVKKLNGTVHFFAEQEQFEVLLVLPFNTDNSAK